MPELNGMRLAVALAVSAAALIAGSWKLASSLASRPASAQRTRPAWTRQQILGLLAILLLALGLRATGLDQRGITHVEVYVPGIDLPERIAEPVRRIDLATTVDWHYFREPHPPAYYLVGWAWTRAFGTELSSLRAPSVVFGVAAVLLLFLLGRRLDATSTALLAALLLAVHGHHGMWSQWARMYAMGTFLGLGSTILYVRLLEESEAPKGLSLLYVAVTLASLATQTLLWTLLAAQMLHAFVTGGRGTDGRPHPVLTLQFACIVIGSPLISQAAFQARPSPFFETFFGVTRDWLGFGFLFPPDPVLEGDWQGLPRIGALAVGVVGALCAAAGLRNLPGHPTAASDSPQGERSSAVPLAWMALGVSGLILAMSMNYRVWQRAEIFAATAILPWLTVAAYLVLPRLQGVAGSLLPERLRESHPLPWMAGAPVLLLWCVYPVAPLLTSRGLLFTVPFLLLLIARGLLRTKGAKRVALVLGVLALHLASWVHHGNFEESLDYRGLAQQVRASAEPEDLFLVHPEDWVTTPIFYDLNHRDHEFVALDVERILATRQPERVWGLWFADVGPSPEMKRALCGFRESRSLRVTNGEAILYLRQPDRTTHCSEAP